MNAIIVSRVAVTVIAVISLMIAGMQIQDDKTSAATVPFLIGVACLIIPWFVQ